MSHDGYNIEIKNLSIGYKQTGKPPVALREGIYFTARKGEMIALIGSNGIGKSTLLRSLIGFQEFFSGDILIGGQPIQKITPAEKARVISFVSTEIIRIPNMTVLDLVSYGRFPYTDWFGRLTKTDRQCVDEAIASVGMEKFRDKPIDQISDGERQRAMIARALAQDTPMIFLDEPTAFLDVSNKYEIFHLLQTLARDNGKTIVFSTHDLNIALREADKFWMMLENENFEGSPEDAVLSGAVHRLFGKSHIGFDTHEGEFYFKKDFKDKVRITGNGEAINWTYRALNRMGYQIVMESTPDFEVKVYSNDNSILWDLIKEGKNTTYTSIYHLGRALQ
jgi:iron complex transport system ATP-binding protein